MHSHRSSTVARFVAVASVAATFAAFGVVVVGASQPSDEQASETLALATAAVWPSVEKLSTELDALRPGTRRSPARREARRAAEAVETARGRVAEVAIPVAATPALHAVTGALDALDRWIDATGSVLANPRSARRADLPRAARDAAVAVARLAERVPAAEGSVAGTGHLLSATRS